MHLFHLETYEKIDNQIMLYVENLISSNYRIFKIGLKLLYILFRIKSVDLLRILLFFNIHRHKAEFFSRLPFLGTIPKAFLDR